MTLPANAAAPALEPRAPLALPAGSSVSLDQWRGLALLLVLLSHGLFFTGRTYGIGRVGVNLFFFISGILVFRSLDKHPERRELDRMRSFWKRRLLRLYPALAAFLVVLVPLAWLARQRPNLPEWSEFSLLVRDLPAAFFYFVNYLPVSPPALNHLWSVSCEMQFYIVAPLLFALGGRSEARRTWVWGAALAVLMVLGALQPFIDYDKKYQFHAAVWPMMLGFFCEHRRAWLTQRTRAWVRPAIAAGVGMLLVSLGAMLFGKHAKPIVVAAGAFALAPCLCCYLAGAVAPGVVGRALRWLGERTYSIYLWQQPLTVCGWLPPVLHPLGAAASTFVGGVWYRVFERPFLSPGRKATT